MHVDGIRVLLIEDNPGDARLLMEGLRDAGAYGIAVQHVTTLGQALTELETNDYEVVLLDLSLPDADGLESVIRLHGSFPKPAIVVLTGLDDQFLAARAVREGAQDYLIKDSTNGHLLVRAMRYAIERRSAIDALQRREEHFRSMIENALDMITIVQREGIIRYASPSHERVLGYRPEELVGSPALALIHEEDAESVAAALSHADRDLAFEYRVRHRSGAWRYVESFARDLTSVPGVQGIVLNSRDVTERHNFEERLRVANQTVRAVLQASPLAICATDTEGRVRTWNRGAQKMFGWAEWEVLEKKLTEVLSFSSPAGLGQLSQVPRSDGASGFDAQCRRRDGQSLDVEFWSELLRDASGNVAGMVHIFADVTERKVLEQQVRHSQKMEAVARLAGGIAHDFNNLLTIITGYTHMMLSRTAETHPDAEDLRQMARAADRATELTRQLLAFSRKQLVRSRVLDLASTVHNIEPMLKRVAGSGIAIRIETEPGVSPVRADPGQLEEVILNLTLNARDAMPNGGAISIGVRSCDFPDPPAGSLMPAGRCVALSFSDTGTGMTPDVLSHIFEPFFTTKPQGKGTGLGLSTSYGIVRQNGGHIQVTSQPGEGTTFHIYLPATSEAVDDQGERAPDQEIYGTETVLLVDDDEPVRGVLESILRRHGYSVLSSGSPEEAVVSCERHPGPIHLLVTDVVMPRCDGPTLVRQIRSRRGDIKVLYISGYSGTRPPHLSGDERFLEKPFTPEAFATTIRGMLNAESVAG
ncbi:MAG TPA: PAS domain S-box protein [Bryobacteraceae bacterium]|nr:PAS domain S-box protein [Bryobacteraceae bacterium]